MQSDKNKLIPVRDVAKLLPVPITRTGLNRWIYIGVRGRKLAVTRVGARVYTTKKEVEEFLDFCNSK